MLTPEYLQRAGELVGAVYTAMEAEMLAHLVSMMVEGKPVTERSSIEVLLLAQSQTDTLRRICERYGLMINESLRLTVEDALHRVSEGLVGGTGDLPQQIELTTSGIAEILARDNLDMVEDAKDLFIQESTRAITFTNAGVLTGEEAIRCAVRELEGKGLGIVTYRATKKGMQGVRNKVDVAVKRHVRTQIAQDGARFMLERLEALDVALVEVSSHADSRPEHAGWQGQCYSLHGTVEIDGTVYPDFYEATGYGTVTGLCGANCRHHFGPYAHGMPRAYEPNPEHPSGLPGEEVYELEQDQRLAERRIREAKREVQGAQILYDERPELDNLTNLNRAKAKVRERQAQMRELIQDANGKSITGTRVLTRNYTREWVGEGSAKANLAAIKQKVDKMAAEMDRIQWPPQGKPMNPRVRKAIKAYASKNGVTLALPKGSDASPRVLKRYIDAAARVANDHPELWGSGKRRLTINVAHLDPNDFGITHMNAKHIINVNADSVRSEATLAREYGKLADDGWFVRGTTYESVIYHELGHIYAGMHHISGKRIVRGIMHTDDQDMINAMLKKHLSEYSTKFSNGQEVIAEAFSAWYGQTRNELANQIMEDVLRVP